MTLVIKYADSKNLLALVIQGKIVCKLTWQKKVFKKQDLLNKIDQLLAKAGISAKKIRNIAIFRGPGSFTSLRVGISVANALAFSLGKPIISFDSKNSKLFAIGKMPASKNYVIPHYGN